MFENHYLFINLVCCCLLLVSSSLNVSNISRSRVCHPKQSSALLKLKEEFAFERSYDDDKSSYPRMKYWNAETDCCIWDGITCDMETGNVIGIYLSNSWLKGPLRSNSSLFNFLHIQRLNLAYNSFTLSSIPKELAQLSRLTHLNFSSSRFTGYISSEISWLTKLVSLDLSFNEVTLRKGDMTRLIKNMTSLRRLHLNWVNISSSFPASLANLSSLTSLSLSYCDLLGEFPNNIFQLSNIEAIDVSYNVNLGGLLPEFNSSNKLKSLKLRYTNFSGRLPESISNLKSLNVLGLTISGNVPPSLWNMSQLIELELSGNKFNEISSILGNLAMLKNLELLTLSSFLNSQSSSSSSVLRELKNLTRLKSLDLSDNFLTGQFPIVLANFTQLSSLYLYSNQLTGPIPSSINIILNSITTLYLDDNSFTGVVPSSLFTISSLTSLVLSRNKFIGSLHLQNISSSQLESLDLSENKLSGPFPTSLFRLTNLVDLVLSSNKFIGSLYLQNISSSQFASLHLSSNRFNGTIEFENFSELSHLRSLSLSNNNLSVKFTNKTSTIPKFQYLDLSSCNINGNIPNFLRSQDELEILDLSNNKLEGEIPKWFWSIGTETLNQLNLSHNFISGFEQAPPNFTWRQIYYLDMRSNTLQGSLPVPPLSTVYYFISENNLTGKIHPSICKLSNLIVLDVSNNSLSGSLPNCLGNFSSSLQVLQLKGNNFEGEIPQISTSDCTMKTLEVSHNKLQGEIPESLNRCGGLEVLNLGHNQLNDTFPFWLQNLPELKVLVLRSNKFHGPICNPNHFSGFGNLKIIDLSFNNFSGTFPSDYFRNWTGMSRIHDEDKSGFHYMEHGNFYYQDSLTLMNKGLELEYRKILTTLTSIDLSSNNFHGELPKSMADLHSLKVLNLSSNNFNGLVPSFLSNLVALESLDLSRNNFYGRIPPQLTSLTFLAYLNLSQNNLTGPIPNEKQFSTFQNSSFEGNPGLCGPPLSNTCEKQDTPKEHEGSNYFDWKISLIGYGSGLVIGICIGHVFITPRWIYWFLRVLRRNLCW